MIVWKEVMNETGGGEVTGGQGLMMLARLMFLLVKL